MTNPLMEYLTPVSQHPQAPTSGANKYYGAVATGYDAKRENDPKWTVEQRIIEDMLSDLPRDTRLLDCPVGTGRFLKCYADRGFIVLGMDRSPDMLQQALKKGEPLNLRGELRQGNILQTGLPDDEVDVAVNCRITRWVIGEHGPAGIQQMLREMQRVAKKRIILTARVANHPYAVSMDLIESALGGWRVARNEAGYVLDYRVLALEAVA